MYATPEAPTGRVNFGWIGEAWTLFAAQAGVWVLAALICGAISVLAMYVVEMAVMLPMMMRMVRLSGGPTPDPAAMMHTMMPTMMLVSVAVGCTTVALNAFFGGGLLKMANNAVRGYFIGVGDLFSGGPTFVALALCQLVFFVPYLIYMLVSYGFIFGHTSSAAFYPGSVAYWHMLGRSISIGLAFDIVPIVLTALFWPAASMAADGQSAREALGKSFNAMKGSWLIAAVFMLVVAIIGFSRRH